MTQAIKSDANDKMTKAVEATRKELGGIRTGRASTQLLEGIVVNYYGVPTPIQQVATLAVPEPRSLEVKPWDKNATGEIVKAIMKADLGLTPVDDGKSIRINIPPLNDERRRELVKLSKRMGEEGKVAVRNIRREANEKLKAAEKGSEISEDESRRFQDEVQKLTDATIKKIDDLLAAKEKEILEG